ncbi:alpha/beta fold hydrolase [Marinicella sp. W31]|uniref:alpha/beta fold hydrolase n=1 Tax=Marinicella sp. W31 TaxID=3023713 RepID=UPI0037562FCD
MTYIQTSAKEDKNKHKLMTSGFILILSLLIIGCQHNKKPASNYTSYAETVQIQNEVTLAYERGIIALPMNRASENKKTINVEFYRFKKEGQETAQDIPPLFILKGGPGFEGLGPSLNSPWHYENSIRPYAQITDVVVVGQRGFGTSFDTHCEDSEAVPVEQIFDFDAQYDALVKALEKCRIKWEKADVDLEGFNVKEAAADVDAIAQALGYPKIQLLGASFGSHWGMTVIKYFPNRVARATFSALEGPDHSYDRPQGMLNTYQRIAATAEASEQFKDLIPEQGLIKAFQALIQSADKNPIPFDFKVPNSDQVIAVNINGDHLRELIGGYSQAPSFRHRMVDWPSDMLSLLNGDFQGALTHLYQTGLSTDVRTAAFFHYDCGSGVSEQNGKIIRNDPAASTVGKTWQFYDISCKTWDADLGKEFRQALNSDIPTVLIHGNWDMSTPYENAAEVRAMFSNHKFIHIEQGSHGSLLDAVVESPGFEAKLHTWMRTGQFDHLPERVEFPPLRWRVR